MKGYLLSLILSVCLGSVAQLLLKKSVAVLPDDITDKIKFLACSPFLWGGLICYGLSMLFWLNVLSLVELSKAYPLVSLGYVCTLFLGYFFLEESLDFSKIVGIMLIMIGVYFLSK